MTDLALSRRRFLALGAACAAAPFSSARASQLSDLYRARTIVTGQRPETRIPGLMRCLTEVIVRVSGDQRLASHPLLTEFSQTPEAAVLNFDYRDLYARKKLADEQGTRDRPYEMTVAYDPAKVDAMLARMGSKPWLGERPRLMVFLSVWHIGTTFLLTSSTEAGDLMMEAFQNASWNYAMPVVIPPEPLITKAGLDVESLPGTSLADLDMLVDKSVGQIPLAGTLRWRKDLLAWEAHWRMLTNGVEHRWAIAGVNFDAAFRNAVGGAAQILSGNGDPV
jgi:hypothetical protein